MSQTENVIFAVVLAIAVAAFLQSAWRLVSFIRLGKPDGRLSGELVRRFWTMLVYAFWQRRVRKEPYGWNHFFLFWGFIILFLANGEFVIAGLFPSLTFELLGERIYGVLLFLFDVVSMIVLVNVAIAFFRRLVLKPAHIEYNSRDGYLILSLIGALMLAFFCLYGSEFASGTMSVAGVMPFTETIFAPLMGSLFGSAAPIAARVFWWLHGLIVLSFLNYLPYSKHMHILTAIPNCYARSFEYPATVPREEFKPGAQFGVSVVDEFSWKDLLDFTACTECGRCNQNCPATSTGKPLNPRLLVHDGKVNLLTNGPKLLQGNRSANLLPLIGTTDEHEGTVGEDALWACTTCGACMTNCPVFIEHVPKIIKMRRHLVENEARFPHELSVFFESVEQRSNPWGITPGDRAKWARDLSVPLMSDAKCDTLFFVGCAGAFDARNKKVATAVVRALKAAGVEFAILGTEEKCCGDSVRRLGNEYLFERMAKANVELFKKYDVRRIITYCPHCYTTLKHDYRQFGMETQVVHHSEFLHELLETGRLKLDGNKPAVDGKVLYHDSCYLGRYNGLYEEPREVVQRVTGRAPVEMDRRLEKSFCCGAGGGRMWMEEEPEHRINANRVREALGKDADVIAVACPYCMTMFDDGIKDEHAEGRVRVMDIAELVAARLPG